MRLRTLRSQYSNPETDYSPIGIDKARTRMTATGSGWCRKGVRTKNANQHASTTRSANLLSGAGRRTRRHPVFSVIDKPIRLPLQSKRCPSATLSTHCFLPGAAAAIAARAAAQLMWLRPPMLPVLTAPAV